jgi:CRP-like cAMP-binding protein
VREILGRIIPDDKVDDLLSIGKKESVKSSQYFIRSGEVPRKFAFVFSGLFRYVYIKEDGNEFTKGIISEQNFISSYSAMILQSPSHFFIEALEDSEILTLPYNAWLRLVETDIFWVKLLLGFVEKGFMIKEKRERDLLLLSAEARYINFLNEYPGMEHRISQTTIASYLGIQPESLSRIKKSILT